MKNLLLLCLGVLSYYCSDAQFYATVQLDEPIEGLCDSSTVYLLFTFNGQRPAIRPVSTSEIQDRLTKNVTYVKENLKFKGDFLVNLVINCEGEVLQCKMDKPSKSAEFDQQVIAVLENLGKWEPGVFDDEKVDSQIMFSIQVKKGGEIIFIH